MSDFDATESTRILQQMGYNAQTVKYNPENRATNDSNEISSRLSTGEISAAVRAYNASSNAADNGKKIVHKEENVQYKEHKGTLIKYEDGTVEFVVQQKNKSGKDTYQTVLKFDKEKDFSKQKPSSQVVSKMFDGRLTKVQETTYKYYHNGKVKFSETKNKNNIVIKQSEFNKKGKVTKNIINDKDGNLQATYIYTYEKDGTRLSRQTDKDGNLVATGKTTYNGDKPVTTQSWYPDEAMKSDVAYDENGKIRTKKEFFQSGKLSAETEFYDNGVIRKQTIYNEDGSEKSRITDEIDGEFDIAAQKGRGDCYLMASIDALRETEAGRQMLSNLITITTDDNGKKVYTVTFPGAIAGAESLKIDNRIKEGSVAITGTYTFTEEEMQEKLKQAGIEYAIGDGDYILVEAAFEKYREEVRQTLEDNNLKNKKYIAGMIIGPDENDTLYGGYTYDALYVLTGQKSELYQANPKPNYCLDSEQLHNGEISVIPRTNPFEGATLKATSEVSYVTGKKTELDQKLDMMMNDSADGKIDYIGTAGFITKDAKGKLSGHALTVKSVTKDTVTLINPWFPDKEVTMTRADFIASIDSFALTPLASQQSQPPKPNDNNGNSVTNTPPAGNDNNNNSGTTNVPENDNPAPATQPSAPPATSSDNQPPKVPDQFGTYTIRKGTRYTDMIKEMLNEQNIPITKENIKKAKEQFEALNPGAVKTNNRFKNKRGQLIPYVLAGAKVKTPKFENM